VPPSSLDVTLQHPSAEPSPLTQTSEGEQQPSAISPSTLLPVTLQKAASGPYRPLTPSAQLLSAQPLSEIDPSQSTLLPTAAPRASSTPSSPPSPSLTATPISTFAGYELLGIIGRGGMGVVHKARHLKLKRLAAVKMILNSHANSDQRDRFRGEAEAVARLQHPNIVQIYEVGEDQDRPFIALEFVDGGSLDKKLARQSLPPRSAAALVETLARAVEAAHQGGIVHRDLKPANILLAGGPDTPIERCVPKITDFGLAKHIDENVGHTQSGAILGTPYYMAPEQAAGNSKEIGPLSDVYALGIILYECLVGRPPFNGATLVEILDQVRNEEPVPPRRRQSKVPHDLETICLKCIDKHSHRRYRSAEAFSDDLKRFLDDEPILARRVRWWERAIKWAHRRPSTAALLGVLLAVALALPVAGLLFSVQLAKNRQAEQKRIDEGWAEVQELLVQGQTAAQSDNWTGAKGLLDRAIEKIDAEPALADLREPVEIAQAPVTARLQALHTYRRFVAERDQALFFATLASGDSIQVNRSIAQEKARAALGVVGLSPDRDEALHLASSFTGGEQADITTGSYSLLLMLAEMESRRLPRQTAEDHRKRLRQALALLDRADRLGATTRAIHMRRERYLTVLGDHAGAARESEQARILAPKTERDHQDHFLVGHELFSQGKLEQAIQEFHRALQLNAGHFWTHYFLALCCVTLRNPSVAVAHLTICQGQHPDLIWIYLHRGFALAQLKDYTAAEMDFDRALAMKPGPATLYVLYNNRGVMRVERKETRAKGIEDLTQAVKLRPDQYQAQASLAEAFRLDERTDEAVKHIDEAIAVAGRQLRSGDVKPAALAQLYHSRARLHLKRSERDAAIRDLTEAARLAENDPSPRARAEADRGRVLHLEQRLNEALAAFDAAHRANPAFVSVHRWRGEVLLRQGRYKEAAAAFDVYLEKGGERSVAVYRQRGLARTKTQRHAESIADYTRALEANPRDEEKAPLYLSRGQEYFTLNSMTSALSDLSEALRLDPGNANAALACAHVHIKLKETHEAVAQAEAVVKRKPADPHLWYEAARIYAQAAGQIKAEPGYGKVRSLYQERAETLLTTAMAQLPARQRPAYWKDKVLKDPALNAIRADLAELGRRAGVSSP
jgi:tetratricopeptide (TPR) repeat protein/tRNA A-37 threonylcarbamoyl transferase component Bud32